MIVFEALSFIFFALAVYFFFKNREWKIKFEQKIRQFLDEKEKGIRQDAIERSARVLSGKTLEKLVPFLKEFKYNSHDIRWLGDPIDFVIFDGYSQNKEISRIVFCEVKSGESKLSPVQNKIKALVQEGKISWDEFKIK